MKIIISLVDKLAELLGDMADRILTPAGIVLIVLLLGGQLDKSLQGRVVDMAFGAMTPTVFRKAGSKIIQKLGDDKK